MEIPSDIFTFSFLKEKIRKQSKAKGLAEYGAIIFILSLSTCLAHAHYWMLFLLLWSYPPPSNSLVLFYYGRFPNKLRTHWKKASNIFYWDWLRLMQLVLLNGISLTLALPHTHTLTHLCCDWCCVCVQIVINLWLNEDIVLHWQIDAKERERERERKRERERERETDLYFNCD